MDGEGLQEVEEFAENGHFLNITEYYMNTGRCATCPGAVFNLCQKVREVKIAL